MANLTLTPTWTAGVYQLETTDPVLGGPGGIANQQAQALGERTEWLKSKVDPLLTSGLFPGGTVTKELAPGATLATSDSGKLIIVNDDSGGPYTGQGFIFLPLPSAMNSAGLDGAVIGIASGDHSYELGISVNDGSTILRMAKPSGYQIYVGFGVVIFKYSQARNAWALVASDTSESVFPVGMVSAFAKGVAPTGWLECAGQLVDQETYPLLFAYLGQTYGNATGSQFRLPDLRGEFIRGWDHGRGVDVQVLAGNTISGSATISGMTGTSTLVVGMPVSGTGIPANATIATIVNSTSITISANATATGVAVALTFGRGIGSYEPGTAMAIDSTGVNQTYSPTITSTSLLTNDPALVAARTGLDYDPNGATNYPNTNSMYSNGDGTGGFFYGVARPRNIAMMYCIKF